MKPVTYILLLTLLSSTEGFAQATSGQACLQMAQAEQCSTQPNPFVQSLRVACEEKYRSLNCDRFFEGTTPTERARFLDCNKPADLCSLASAPVHTCANSAVQAVVEFGASLYALPGAVLTAAGNFPAAFARCQTDERFKRELLGPFRPAEMTDETIARMSCADVRAFVEQKIDVLVRRVDQRITDRATRRRRDRESYSDLVLTEQETHAVNFVYTQNPSHRLVACYNRDEKIRFICGEAAATAAGAGVGAAARVVVNRIAAAVGGRTPPAGPVSWTPTELEVSPLLLRRYPGLRFVRESPGSYSVFLGANKVGYLIIERSGSRLKVVELALTEDSVRRRGFSRELVRAALRDNPDVRTITAGSLALDNAEVLRRELSRGASVEEAIRKTPAYRIRASQGFTEIVPGSYDVDGYGFAVRRPTPSPRTGASAAQGAAEGGLTLTFSPAVERELEMDEDLP